MKYTLDVERGPITNRRTTPTGIGRRDFLAGLVATGLMGGIERSNRACILEIPFSSQKGRIVHVSFWVCGDKSSACAVFVRIGKEKISLGRRIDNIPARAWKQVQAVYRVEKDTAGVIQIVAPSSFNAPPGRTWIDDVEVYETLDECNWPGRVEDFPALACDKSDNLWMAGVDENVQGLLVKNAPGPLQSPDYLWKLNHTNYRIPLLPQRSKRF